MRFIPTTLDGAWLIESDRHEDERGFFARLHCSREFAAHGLPETFVQSNLSHNEVQGTFRGLHYQVPPSKEGKLVRCMTGSIADVIADLRPGSPSFLQHEWFDLSDSRIVALW